MSGDDLDMKTAGWIAPFILLLVFAPALAVPAIIIFFILSRAGIIKGKGTTPFEDTPPSASSVRPNPRRKNQRRPGESRSVSPTTQQLEDLGRYRRDYDSRYLDSDAFADKETFDGKFQEAYYSAKERGKELEPWELPPERTPWEL